MQLHLLCNAGFLLKAEEASLLVDAPNRTHPPFYTLPSQVWQEILDRRPPYDHVCGLWFSHNHPDHCDLDKARDYLTKWPDAFCFVPEEKHIRGKGKAGPFEIEYQRVNHAPIPMAPPHVVTWIKAGEKSVYFPSDAELNCEVHRNFLKNRKADVAIWNSMYLSKEDTRQLMTETAGRNFICHMPQQRPDEGGLWRKLEKNLERFGEELQNVTIVDHYPFKIEI